VTQYLHVAEKPNLGSANLWTSVFYPVAWDKVRLHVLRFLHSLLVWVKTLLIRDKTSYKAKWTRRLQHRGSKRSLPVVRLCPVVTEWKILRSEIFAPPCARLLERPEDNLHRSPTKKGCHCACWNLYIECVLKGADSYLAVVWVENYFAYIGQDCKLHCLRSRLDWNFFAVACVISVFVNYRMRFTYVMCRVEIHVARAVNNDRSCLACVVRQTRELQSETFQLKLLRCDKIPLVNTFRL
jgi:hypothetical protein